MLYKIALISMLINHFGVVFFPNIELFVVIGRIAFPIFAWGVAEGAKKTKKLEHYQMRLLIIAIVSQVPYYLLFNNYYLNVCFTLFLGLSAIKIYTKINNVVLKVLSILMLILISHYFNVEYGIYGVLLILIYYFSKERLVIAMLQILITIIGINIYNYPAIQLYSLLALPCIFVFRNIKDQKRIPSMVKYSIYPIHILLFYFVGISIKG
ncbi:TraX family protein [Alkaliphilus hydrothermalis]|uniref:TraX protein n=1 Tax=Alkaliphilus hydrothermalis TaxID=1482730 RepID=A0ABS2NRB5_9FIRM|nr:TraX family protein [Alkaliphilus hydrothermalis]MBM7615495.1 hypothetical protein [Alkaliphilus hydrothermalis]